MTQRRPDIDLVTLQTNFALSETLNLGFDAYWVNMNGAVDANEKKVYFEFSDYSTSYVFYEQP